MKRTRMAAFVMIFAAMLTLGAAAAEEDKALIASLTEMDEESGAAAAQAAGVDWHDTLLLSKAIYACTGNRTFTDEWRLCVGEVVLNRVESPEFPDTLEEVLRSDERYSGLVPGYLDAVRPDKKAAEIAVRLMKGERVMEEKKVVWQDCHYYDGGVYKSLYDYRVGGIFFCLTTHPELYE